jgi:hypothetical protein
MRNIITIALILLDPFMSKAQTKRTLSDVCRQVSELWTLDSNSCRGDRLQLSQLLVNAKPDSITKRFLFSTLGKPNLIKKYYVGYPDRKNYVEYIYYIYKDDCPKIFLEGSAIGFIFDESERYFIRIEDHYYCG